MSPRWGVLLAVALVAGLIGAPIPREAAAQPSARCNHRSWIAGSVDLCGGVLIYRDYVYDDYGADEGRPGAQSTAPLSNPAGDKRYAEDVNSADLVDLSLRVVGDRLHVTFELNALYNPASTVAALAIDTDNDRSTGGGEWRDLAVRSEGWDVLETFDVGDPATNVIKGHIPLPPGDRWRLQALTAIKAGPVMNVAFRGTNEETTVGTWWEDKQAAALREGDISQFGHVVDVADMTAGVTRPAQETPGLHERVYTSRYTMKPGEGMSYEGRFGRHGDTGRTCEQEFHFFGRYQPYGIYIPDNAGPHGMQLAMHGCSANHASLIDQPGMQQRLGEEVNRIIVNPLGRGPYGYYSDISERDVLDVMRDVHRNYDVDRDQVFAGGYSMGGYGAYRMAMLYPHRFAGLISWVGFTGDCLNGPAQQRNSCPSGAIGNVINYVPNLRHVPSAMLYMGQDELVHMSSWHEMNARFLREGGPYAFYKHPAGDHFTLALADDWSKEARYTAGRTRVRNPGRVRFRTRSFLGNERYNIAHDRAYWISKIEGRRKTFIDINARSRGCGWDPPRTRIVTREGPDPVPWVAEIRKIVGHKDARRRAKLRMKLDNVRQLRIDTKRACLAGKRIDYWIQTDGPVTIRFSDGRRLRFDSFGRYSGALKRR